MNPSLSEVTIVGKNIVIEPVLEEELVDGFVKTINYEDKAPRGIVVAIGNEVENIRKGMIVYFNKYSTISFSFYGKEYLSLPEYDVIAYYNER